MPAEVTLPAHCSDRRQNDLRVLHVCSACIIASVPFLLMQATEVTRSRSRCHSHSHSHSHSHTEIVIRRMSWAFNADVIAVAAPLLAWPPSGHG
eukprot:1188417-Prorocentrum_minimum.AAC.1